jgi:soluble lytic murein transglycosylase-like protein
LNNKEKAAPSQPLSTDTICSALAAAAAQNDLPTNFFARLIWRESRFDPAAVSRAGAQGVAQFMPATANWRGLSNPFDPLEAIAESAKLLRDLRREFGNLGLGPFHKQLSHCCHGREEWLDGFTRGIARRSFAG